MMNQIYNTQPVSLIGLRSGLADAVDEVIRRALAKNPALRYETWDEFAQALSSLIANHEVPRGQIQGVLDSERFTMLRSLDFFSDFGDVELWEVVHRAKWQRFPLGHAVYRKGEEGRYLSHHRPGRGGGLSRREPRRAAGRGHVGRRDGVPRAEPRAAPPQRRRDRERARHHHLLHARHAGAAQSQLPPSLRRGVHPRAGARLHVAHEALAHPRRIL
jgi:hypothetical protein